MFSFGEFDVFGPLILNLLALATFSISIAAGLDLLQLQIRNKQRPVGRSQNLKVWVGLFCAAILVFALGLGEIRFIPCQIEEIQGEKPELTQCSLHHVLAARFTEKHPLHVRWANGDFDPPHAIHLDFIGWLAWPSMVLLLALGCSWILECWYNRRLRFPAE